MCVCVVVPLVGGVCGGVCDVRGVVSCGSYSLPINKLYP